MWKRRMALPSGSGETRLHGAVAEGGAGPLFEIWQALRACRYMVGPFGRTAGRVLRPAAFLVCIDVTNRKDRRRWPRELPVMILEKDGQALPPAARAGIRGGGLKPPPPGPGCLTQPCLKLLSPGPAYEAGGAGNVEAWMMAASPGRRLADGSVSLCATTPKLCRPGKKAHASPLAGARAGTSGLCAGRRSRPADRPSWRD